MRAGFKFAKDAEEAVSARRRRLYDLPAGHAPRARFNVVINVMIV